MGRLSGRIVLEGSDRPAPGVTVTVEGTALSAIVGSDGRFMFMQIPQGTYRLVAGGIGFETVVIERVEVEFAKTTDISITVRATTLPSEDPIVTPGKRLQTRRESSSSLYVVTASEISLRNVNTLDRLLEGVPGVMSGAGAVSIRGSDGSGYGIGSRVMLLVDGFPVLTPDNGMIPSTTLPLHIADQVEVIKGAASVLHGSGAVGGVVNVVTREPAEQMQGMVRAYTGVFTPPGSEEIQWWGSGIQRFAGAEGYFSRKAGSIGLMLGGGTHHDDGYRQNDDRDRYNVHGKIIWTLSPRSSFRLSASIAGDDHGGFTNWRASDSSLLAQSTSDSVSHRIVNESNLLAGELRGYISQLFSYVARGGIYNTTRYDSSAPGNGMRGPADASRYFGELQMNSRINRNVMFTYGGAMQFDVATSEIYGSQVTRATGLFAQMEFGNNIDIDATIGGRLDMLLAPGAAVYREIHISPRVGLAYHPFDATTLRFSIGRAFRAPTIVERYLHSTIAGLTFVPNRALASERTWQGELGASHEIRIDGVTLTADAAVFVHEHFGLIEPVLNAVNREISYLNITRARVLGAEMMLTGILIHLPLRFSVDLSTFAPRDLRLGADLPGRSNFISHASLAWTPGAWTLSLDYRYLSRPQRVEESVGWIIPDAATQFETSNIDVRIAVDLRSLAKLPFVGTLTTRNLLQDRYTNAVGSIGPIRNVEAGIEGRF
jgi:iron complex outermembrane receptor protein